MKSRVARSLVVTTTAVILGAVTTLPDAAAERLPRRVRTFSRVLTLGKSFAVSSTDCSLSVMDESAARLDVACFNKARVRTGPARIALSHNQYGTLRSRGCALSVTSRNPSRVNVSCVAVPPAHSFVGTVTCDTPGNTPQSKVVKASMVFNQPINLSDSVTSGERKPLVATQVGGLAGSLVNGRRSQLAITIPDTTTASDTTEKAIQFKVAAAPASGRYNETGTWRVGVSAKGAIRLQGESTAALNSEAQKWRASCKWDLAATPSGGPVSLKMIDKLLTPATAGTGTQTLALVGSSSDAGCGSMFSAGTDGLSVVAAVINVFTPASVFLSVASVGTTIAGAQKGNACLTSSLSNVNEQLATQAYQIQQIENYLGLATNTFYTAWYQVQLAQTSNDAKSWKETLSKISPRGANPNAFGTFMSTGLGLWNSSLQPAVGAITDPQQLAVSLSDYQFGLLASQIAAGEVNGFQSWVDDFSGTTAVLPDPTCVGNCPITVSTDPDAYLIHLYEQLFATLQADIDTYIPPVQQYNSAANQNIVPLYDQYNTMLVNFYQQSLVGLQQAFTMEWLVNQMNYYRASGTTNKTQLPSWGQVGGTLYQYSNQSPSAEAAAYNLAQKNLAKLYAARFNRLYLNTLNYVVSDVPVFPQAYPNTPISFTIAGKSYTENSINYSGEVGKSLTTSSSGSTPQQGATPLSLVPPVAKGAWQSAAVLYQFSGLYDAAKCISSLDAYNVAASSAGGTMQEWLQTPGACPSIFLLADGTPLNQGYYDGNTLTPYTSFKVASRSTGGPMVLTGTMQNNLKFCDHSSPALGWYAPSGGQVGNAAGMVAGKAYINCGRWYTPGFQTCGFPRANCPPAPADLYKVDDAVGATELFDTNINCSKRYTINGNSYPLILTLTDSLPSEMHSCSAAIPTVVYSGTTISPILSQTRLESGSFETGGAGCSLGYIGSGIGNPLPNDPNTPDNASFGLRMMNYTDSGNQGHSSGWLFPMKPVAYCHTNGDGTHPWLYMYMYAGSIATTGFTCTVPSSSYNTQLCTILDGTTYNLTTKIGAKSVTLDISVVR